MSDRGKATFDSMDTFQLETDEHRSPLLGRKQEPKLGSNLSIEEFDPIRTINKDLGEDVEEKGLTSSLMSGAIKKLSRAPQAAQAVKNTVTSGLSRASGAVRNSFPTPLTPSSTTVGHTPRVIVNAPKTIRSTVGSLTDRASQVASSGLSKASGAAQAVKNTASSGLSKVPGVAQAAKNTVTSGLVKADQAGAAMIDRAKQAATGAWSKASTRPNILKPKTPSAEAPTTTPASGAGTGAIAPAVKQPKPLLARVRNKLVKTGVIGGGGLGVGSQMRAEKGFFSKPSMSSDKSSNKKLGDSKSLGGKGSTKFIQGAGKYDANEIGKKIAEEEKKKMYEKKGVDRVTKGVSKTRVMNLRGEGEMHPHDPNYYVNYQQSKNEWQSQQRKLERKKHAEEIGSQKERHRAEMEKSESFHQQSHKNTMKKHSKDLDELGDLLKEARNEREEALVRLDRERANRKFDQDEAKDLKNELNKERSAHENTRGSFVKASNKASAAEGEVKLMGQKLARSSRRTKIGAIVATPALLAAGAGLGLAKAKYDETKHRRDEDGKFTHKGFGDKVKRAGKAGKIIYEAHRGAKKTEKEALGEMIRDYAIIKGKPEPSLSDVRKAEILQDALRSEPKSRAEAIKATIKDTKKALRSDEPIDITPTKVNSVPVPEKKLSKGKKIALGTAAGGTLVGTGAGLASASPAGVLARYDETKHRRDESGKFTHKGFVQNIVREAKKEGPELVRTTKRKFGELAKNPVTQTVGIGLGTGFAGSHVANKLQDKRRAKKADLD